MITKTTMRKKQMTNKKQNMTKGNKQITNRKQKIHFKNYIIVYNLIVL